MRALRYASGGPEVMHIVDTPASAPKDGDLLIRVKAASVNPIE